VKSGVADGADVFVTSRSGAVPGIVRSGTCE